MNLTTILALAFPESRQHITSLRDIIETGRFSEFIFKEVILPQEGSACFSTCLKLIKGAQPDVVVVSMETIAVRAVLEAVLSVRPDLPVWAFTDGNASDPDRIYELLDLGVADFLVTPLRAIDLLPPLWKLKSISTKKPLLSRSFKERMGLKDFVGESPSLLAALQKIPAVAGCDAGVLITGETGTGKELCARAIHYLSTRANKPFVPVNCGAIPVDLVENELFGHEQGAFTGANGATPGLLRAANGGTILLDEIDALPLAAQVKLLRFLQERQIQPLGSSKTCTVDLRLIAACNTNLTEAVRTGRFRQDLYYRLNVVPIELPPLRQRTEDIPILARYFLSKYTAQFAKPVSELSYRALQKLVAYDWPGNIRELENVIERAVIFSNSTTLHAQDMQLTTSEIPTSSESFKTLKARAIERFERNYLQQLLCAYQGNITRASLAAKKDRRAFWELMRKHHLVVSANDIAA